MSWSTGTLVKEELLKKKMTAPKGRKGFMLN